MADTLLPAQLQRLQRVFLCFAKSTELSDGTTVDAVSATELRAVLQSLGLHPTDAELHETISKCDTTGRGYLDLSQFVQLMCNELPDTDNQVELVELFSREDRNRDGLLDAGELASAIATATPAGTEASADVPLTVSDMTAVIEEAAGVGAQGVTLPQFLQLMRTQS